VPVGRTSWWPCDSAEHDRELNVELGEEFGAEGPYLMRVMKDLAQAQRAEGFVRTGFRSLRSKTFIASPERVRQIVEYAGEIGALDELILDADGRRFTCRVSGWEADQARGREAIKKAAQRAKGHVPNQVDSVPTEGDMSTSRVDVSGFVPPTRDNQSRTEQLEEEDARETSEDVSPSGFTYDPPASALHTDLPEVLEILATAPGLQIMDMAVNAACMARPGSDVVAAAREVASWALEGGLQVKAANRLLLSALDKTAKRDAQLTGVREAAAAAGVTAPRAPRSGVSSVEAARQARQARRAAIIAAEASAPARLTTGTDG
jgi:hypothetical protein